MTSSSIRPTPLRRAILIVVVVPLLGLGVFAGCQSQPKPVEQPPAVASADKYSALRQSIQAAQPGSLVGRVLTTSTTYGPYAAVEDIAVQNVKVGDTITFLDADAKPVNAGEVRAIVGDQLHVRYDPAGKRAVQTGDIAVWFKS
jgi:hypothetical protein